MDYKKIYHKIDFRKISVLLFLIYGLFQIHYGEKVGLRDGRGWDGVTYAFYVQHFDSLWHSGMLNKAHLLTSDSIPLTEKRNRFLASMLVHYGMKTLDMSHAPANIVRAFEYHNLIWLILAVISWSYITEKLALQTKDKWLGLILLFGNFAILKHDFYNPINTDLIAYSLIVIQIAFFFYRFHIGIIITGLCGAFVWQPITIYAYLMLLFPFNTTIVEADGTRFWNICLFVFSGSIFFLGFWSDWQLGEEIGSIQKAFSRSLVAVFGQSPVNMKYFYLSAILAFIFTCLYFSILLQNIAVWRTIRSLWNKSLILGTINVVILLISTLLLNQLFSPQEQEVVSSTIAQSVSSSNSNPLSLFLALVYNNYAFHKPLEFYIAHITFFGLSFLIAGLYFYSFSHKIRTHGGLAILLVFAISYGTMILNPQSRIGTALAPFVTLYATLIISDLNIKKYHYLIIILLSIAVSKIWYPIGDFIEDFHESYARYFMNWGTWMNLRMLIIQAILFIVISIYLIWIGRKSWVYSINVFWKNVKHRGSSFFL